MLPEIRIASPCTAKWEEMTGDARSRHCAECNLDVYNFSAMTSIEIEQLLAASKDQRVCGRFYRRSDGTILTSDCPVGFRNRVRRVSRFAGAALTAAMSVSFAAAQVPQDVPALTQIAPAETGLEIIVVDSSGAVVPGARVDVKGSVLRFSQGTTDSSGRFKLSSLPSGEYEVTISFLGLESAVAHVKLPQSQPSSIVVKGSLGAAKTHPEAFMGWVVTDSLEVQGEPEFDVQLLGKLFPASAGKSAQPKAPNFPPIARK